MVSTLKSFLNPTILLLDVFPFLLEIIKPTLRPVNTQLYSQQEKNELQRIIELMLAFNLNYRQERTPEGIYNYVLDPNIEELIKLGNLKPKRMLTYSAKQMIAREVEMEQMRKGDNSTDVKEEKAKKESDTKRLLEPKTAQKKEIEAEKPLLDFFGRRIIVSENSK
ncbi:Chromosome transmission fidelity protein 18-like protein, partial [Stegodyphus mimosarum]